MLKPSIERLIQWSNIPTDAIKVAPDDILAQQFDLVSQRAYDTRWGLTDASAILAWLLRAWSRAELRLRAVEDQEKELLALRLQLGKAKKKIQRLED